MSSVTVRIGIIGAGANCRIRHVPGFRAIEGVELVSVCNSTRESSERAAKEFNIPNVYDNWLDLIQSDDTDAICIGTWPNLHAPITISALQYDKHVLTEARMSMNSSEARAMLQASQEAPHLIAQVVPAPMTLPVDQTIIDIISKGDLGDVLSVDLKVNSKNFIDTDSPLHWRQNKDLSGFNILMMGIWYEILMRWIGPARKVSAMTSTFVKKRQDYTGKIRTIEIPDHVDVICEMNCGAQANLRFSAITGLAPTNEAWIFGTDGTLKVDLEKNHLFFGSRNDKELSGVKIDPLKQSDWRVEEEFVNAIRGLERVKLSTFEDGVKYMEFTDAVTISTQSGQAVSLPFTR